MGENFQERHQPRANDQPTGKTRDQQNQAKEGRQDGKERGTNRNVMTGKRTEQTIETGNMNLQNRKLYKGKGKGGKSKMKGMYPRKGSEKACVHSTQTVNGDEEEGLQRVGTKGHQDNKEKTDDPDLPGDKEEEHAGGEAIVLEPTQGQTEEDAEDRRSTPGRQRLITEYQDKSEKYRTQDERSNPCELADSESPQSTTQQGNQEGRSTQTRKEEGQGDDKKKRNDPKKQEIRDKQRTGRRIIPGKQPQERETQGEQWLHGIANRKVKLEETDTRVKPQREVKAKRTCKAELKGRFAFAPNFDTRWRGHSRKA